MASQTPQGRTLVHAILDKQYRATLDEPIGMLGDISPRAAAQQKPVVSELPNGSNISKCDHRPDQTA